MNVVVQTILDRVQWARIRFAQSILGVCRQDFHIQMSQQCALISVAITNDVVDEYEMTDDFHSLNDRHCRSNSFLTEDRPVILNTNDKSVPQHSRAFEELQVAQMKHVEHTGCIDRYTWHLFTLFTHASGPTGFRHQFSSANDVARNLVLDDNSHRQTQEEVRREASAPDGNYMPEVNRQSTEVEERFGSNICGRQFRVVVTTRSMVTTLFERCAELVQPEVTLRGVTFLFEHRRIVGTTACGYFQQLREIDADWVVNLDEDAFLLDSSALCETIQIMDRGGYAACGMPDGGVVRIRHHNPVACNAYFNVFDMRRVRPAWDDWNKATRCTFRGEFNAHIPDFARRTEAVIDNFEPYYGLFFSILDRGESILYLSADEWSDGVSSLLFAPNGAPLLLHAWHARKWSRDSQTRKRITELLQAAMTYRHRLQVHGDLGVAAQLHRLNEIRNDLSHQPNR